LEKSPECRYWDWCQFIAESDRKLLLGKGFQVVKSHLKSIDWSSLDSILLADQTLVLPNDMLKKVDSMSMAHALEVRTPFLDHHVVEFVNALPIDYKLKKNNGKRILKDTFGHLLPSSILTRTKKGFEIPIKEWLADDIDAIFQQTIFSEEYIRNQGLFSFEFIQDLKKTWGDNSFGDRIYVVWTIICFQHWWDKTHKRNNNVNSHS
jgi:asparagine synthase (glutamine-hydrolysing)